MKSKYFTPHTSNWRNHIKEVFGWSIIKVIKKWKDKRATNKWVKEVMNEPVYYGCDTEIQAMKKRIAESITNNNALLSLLMKDR